MKGLSMPIDTLAAFRSICAFLVLLTATHGAAVAKGQKKGNKYGVVDMQAVILNVEEGKTARKKLEQEIKAKEKEFVKAKSELEKMHKEWKQQAPLLSEAARLKKQQEFQEKFLGLRNEEMTFQAEIKRKEQLATQKIAVSVSKVVSKRAKDKKLEMVFETNSAGLLYLDNPVDLTKDVITAYGATAKKDGNTAKKK